jgi:hypothetical protein
MPNIIFPLVAIVPALMLLTRNIIALSSVVPKKFIAVSVPLLPVSSQLLLLPVVVESFNHNGEPGVPLL